MSFAAGFFGTLARGMESKRDFIRNRVEEDRQYLRQQGLQRMAQVQETRTNYETAARELINRGADEQAVLRHLQSNPQGVVSMYREVVNGNIYNPGVLNTIFKINDEYSSGLSLEEVLGEIVPTTRAIGSDVSPPEAERRTIASWLGLDTEEALNEQVYSAQIVGGMTGDDILAALGTPVTPRGSGENVGQLDYTALETAQPLSSTEINVELATMEMEYDSLIANRLQEIQEELAPILEADELTPEDEARRDALIAEQERLEEISGMTRIDKVPEAIKFFGPTENIQYRFSQHPEILTDLPGFGEIAPLFETSEETPVEPSEAQPTVTDGPSPVVRQETPVETTLEDAPDVLKETFSDPAVESVTLMVDGMEVSVTRQEYEEEYARSEEDGREALGGIVDRFGEQPSAMTEAPDQPSASPVVPFSEMTASQADEAITRGAENFLSTSRREATEPTSGRPLFNRQDSRRPQRIRSTVQTASDYLAKPNEDIDPDWVQEVLEELGIGEDTEIGNILSSQLVRDDMESKRVALQFILNEFAQRGYPVVD